MPPGLITPQHAIRQGPEVGICQGPLVGLNASCGGVEAYVPPTTDLVLNLDPTFSSGVRFPGSSGSGNPIDLWIDQHTSSNDFQMTTVADRPTWIANARNGRGAVAFDYTLTQWLEASAFLAGASQAGHIFMVHKVTAPSTANNGWMRFGTPVTDDHYTLTSTTDIYTSFGSTTRKGPIADTDYGTWHLSEIHTDLFDWAYIHNGTTKLTDAGSLPGWNSLAFGFRLGRSQTIYYGGEMGQTIIYSAKKTGADLTNIRAGLSSAWDLGF